MKKSTILFPIFLFSFFFFQQGFSQTNYTQYVNPFIGTGGHGHTFPGATTPFGMVQLSPDTRIDGSWDGCSGYYYGDSIIYGFSHTHLSGTGCSDYGDIAFLPVYAKDFAKPRGLQEPYWATFQHKNETAEAGYYSVLMDNGVKVELTATPRVGLQRYTFTKAGDAMIILNLEHRDELLEGSIHIEGVKGKGSTHFSGIRRSKAWAENQVLFYDFEISRESKKGTDIITRAGNNGDRMLLLIFDVKAGEQILISTGISACDEAGALNNRTTELKDWNFENVKQQAKNLWNKELGKIEVSNEDKNKSTIFYSALYHCMIHPSLYSDVDNRYRGRDNKIHSTEGKFDYYTVFSLWDTYRALHPLLTIIDTKRTNDFINTFLCQYQQGGLLPVWELSSNETNCMIGYHSVSVIWDAYNKGIRGYDANLAYEAMKHSAMQDTHGLKAYKEKGYISSEDDNESVSKTLEYAYDDWCIGQMAKALGKAEDYFYFEKRSQNWKNLFNPENGFFQAKKNGSWVKNFDPYEVNNNYTEANAWQYSVSVPHDLATLNSLYKTSNGLQKHLDELFHANEKTNGRNQADISGLIGQYAHGNEPSHHLIYSYAATDFNNKSEGKEMRRLLSKTVNEFYKNSPDGLIGNEDCGQMSAWYVMSSIGIYSLCPGRNEYIIGESNFNAITFSEKYSHQFNNSSDTFYFDRTFDIISNRENGKQLKNIFFAGDTFPTRILDNSLKFSDSLQFQYSKGYTSKIHSYRNSNDSLYQQVYYVQKSLYASNPFFNNPLKNFNDSFRVEIKTIDKSPIYFSLNGKDFQPYKSPFAINQSCKISAYSTNENSNGKSATINCEFRKLPSNRRLQLLTKYDNLYTAGGDDALIDLERGTANWRIGNWQGYAGKDVVAVVDVGSSKKLKSIGLGCLQDQGAWVMFPPQVIFEGSNDGKTFELISTVNTNVSDTINHAITKDVVVNFYTPTGQTISPEVQTVAVAKPYRYYKVTAKNYGKLPSWHWSKGEQAWLFVDEILMEE